jgi:hypothetical protein
MNDLIVKNKELAALYGSSVDAGMEDVGQSPTVPMIKITTSMSKENVLADGSMSKVGKFYHTELKQDFESVLCSICYIGKFELPDFNNPEDKKMTYVLGGVMEADNTPFVSFVKGYSLQSVWDFIREVMTIKTRYGIPMFGLKVTLRVGQRPHPKFKTVDVFKFDIMRTKDGAVVVEDDIQKATSLRDLAGKFKEIAEAMTRTEEEVDDYNSRMNSTVAQPSINEADEADFTAESVAADIPF